MTSPVLTIIKTELARRKKYMSWWSIGIVVLTAFTVLAYGSIKSQADQLNKAFDSFSSTTGSFFGTSDMFSPAGYLNSQLFYIVLPVLFIILSITLSGALTSKEEGRHTLELLLSRPISRTRLLLAKVLSADIIVAILGFIAMIATLICSKIVGIDVSAGYIILTTVLMVLFSGAFGAVAFALYMASSRSRHMAAAIAILLSLGGYILASVGSLVDSISWTAKLFPYHYYDPGALLHGNVAKGLVIYIAAMYVISLTTAIVGFRRRDIE